MQCALRLFFLILCIATNITMTMKSEKNLGVPVFLKNSSQGFFNTYDIYVQGIPTLQASRTIYMEKFIPYGKEVEIGYLSRIEDIKIRGSSKISGWTCNKEFLDKVKQDAIDSKDTSDGNLLFIVSAGITGFYLSYYNWRPNELGRLGLKRNNNSGEYEINIDQINELHQSNEPHPSDEFKLIG